jgi:hypothetical protein
MNAAPSRWMSTLAGVLLPPSRREQVLGDLEERYRTADPARARRQYLFDALLLVPAIFWSESHRWHIGGDAPSRLRLSSGRGVVRAQVEDFQQENYCRTLFYGSMATLAAAVVAGAAATGDSWAAQLYCVAIMAALLFTVQQHYRRGRGEAVPSDASLPELVTFHRHALERRRAFLRTLWYWKMLPLALPMVANVALRRSGTTIPVLVIVGFALALMAARGQARRIQQQIDELGRFPTIGTG